MLKIKSLKYIYINKLLARFKMYKHLEKNVFILINVFTINALISKIQKLQNRKYTNR